MAGGGTIETDSTELPAAVVQIMDGDDDDKLQQPGRALIIRLIVRLL